MKQLSVDANRQRLLFFKILGELEHLRWGIFKLDVEMIKWTEYIEII